MKSLFKNPLFFLCLTLILLNSFLIFNYVFSWTLPQCSPPNCDLSAPLDTSSVEQTKAGNLNLENNLNVSGLLRIGLFSSHPTGTNGAIYYNTTNHKFYGYQNGSWSELGGGGGFWLANGNNIYYNSGNVGIGISNPGAPLEVFGRVYQSGLGGSTFFGYQAGANDNLIGNENSAFGYDALYSNTDGDDNSAFGSYALYSNTTGYYNSAFGSEALYSNTTGYYNSAFGFEALYSNTDGDGNSAFGSEALYSNTTGYYNSAFGFEALYSNTDGYENSAFGFYALRSNTTGYYNSAFGSEALRSNTTGYYNSAFGFYTLRSNTTGYDNSAFGSYALYSNTTGYRNSAFGSEALFFNTTGYNNSAFGSEALRSNTTGYYNSAFGSEALYSNTTGYYNSAFGSEALSSNTTGYDNSAFGSEALYSNTTGYRNSAFGSFALFSNTTGYNNSAFGSFALSSNTTGYENSAFGFYALRSNTTGYENSAFGSFALRSNTTGYNNSAFGYFALFSNTTGYGNVALGYSAGRYLSDGSSPLSSPTYGVYIGYNTKGYAANETNAIVIGYNAVSAGSNSVVIGNDSITKTILKGNVGIGTTAPAQKLHVEGNIYISGNVGIGTTSPLGRLHIQGNSGSIGLRLGLNPGQPSGYVNSPMVMWDSTNMGATRVYWMRQEGDYWRFNVSDTSGGNLVNIMTVDTLGNVGIGTRGPLGKLHIVGGYVTSGLSGISNYMILGSGGTSPDAAQIIWGDNTGWKLHFGTQVSGTFTPRMTIVDTGNVGIGTTTPEVKLDVDGDIELDLLSTGSTVNVYAVAGGSSGGSYKLVRYSSSQRYKKDIKDFNLGLDIVMKLQPREFTWKSTGERDFGFIAEDAEKVNSFLITYLNGQPEAFRYSQYTAILTNAIKEQQEEIEKLQEKIEKLKDENESLKTEVQQIKKALCNLFPNYDRCNKY